MKIGFSTGYVNMHWNKTLEETIELFHNLGLNAVEVSYLYFNSRYGPITDKIKDLVSTFDHVSIHAPAGYERGQIIDYNHEKAVEVIQKVNENVESLS